MTSPISPPGDRLRSLSLVSCAVLSLAGCGVGKLTQPAAPQPSGHLLQGRAIGGQQPLDRAVIRLYAVGAGGNASAATPLLTQAVITDKFGDFTITGDYPCTDPSKLVYITATGGNPGLPGNAINPSIALMTVLGSCANLLTTPFVTINEVTTAAAAWALAPFMRSTTLVGSTASNVAGLRNAFATTNVLADQATGFSPSSTTPANAAVESAKVYALADVIASCVNSDGTLACSSLFADATPPSGTLPADTLQAALSIVRHPGYNVSAIYKHIIPANPFAGALTASPSDWTLSITYQGSGLHYPTQLGLDSAGDVWVANYFNVLSAFTQQGVPILANGATGPVLQSSFGLAIDANNSIWITDEDGDRSNAGLGSVSRFDNSGASTSGPAGFYAGGIYYPHSLASDPNGNIWVANYGNSTVTLLSPTGTAVSSSPYGGKTLAFPSGIAVDAKHNAWIANGGGGGVVNIASDGAILHEVPTGAATNAIAVDGNGNVWATSYYGSTLVEVSSAGVLLSPPGGPVPGQANAPGGYSGGGVSFPQGLAIDGANNVWLANYHGASISEFSGVPPTVGAALSPATGFGLDTTLLLPFGIAIDASGSVWVSNEGANTVTTFVGLATPVKTPLVGPPQLP